MAWLHSSFRVATGRAVRGTSFALASVLFVCALCSGAVSDDLDSRFFAADDAKRHGDWKQVAEISSDILSKHPNSGRAWYRLGTAKMNLNDDAGAETALGVAAKFRYFEMQSLQMAASLAAKRKDRAATLKYLKKLANRGFDQPDSIQSSPEFAWLAHDPNYEVLRLRIKKNIHWQSVNPRWSKDGKKIIFERGLSEFPPVTSQIYSVDPDGKNETQLTFSSANHLMPDVSPDRQQIVYSTSGEGKRKLHIEDLRSHQSRILVQDNIGNEHFPSWSPDGTRILFNADGTGQRQIYVVNVDGSGLKRLTDAPGNSDYPRWISATQVSFESDRAGMWDAYVMGAEGGRQTRLARASTPDLSPEGGTIVFTDVLMTGHTEVYVVDRDGTAARRLTHTRIENWQPAWSPDGKKIVFQSQHSGRFELYLMNPDGSGVRRLTHTAPKNKFDQ